MSGLLVRVFTKDKAIETEGEVAFGEQVAVAVEFEDATVADASTMRLRVRHMNADVAVFPLVLPDPEDDTGGDAWTPDATAPAGTRWTATLNLNTVQLRAAFGARPCDGASIGALLMVDCFAEGGAALHALGKTRIRWWDANETITGIDGAPGPVDVGEWATEIAERMTDAEADIAEHETRLDGLNSGKADAAEFSTLAETVAGHTSQIADKANKSSVESLADEVAANKDDFDDFKDSVTDSLTGKADLVGGKVPSTQLPSYVDDVLEYANLASFPATGETGKIYVALDSNKTYRWGGTAYAEISKSLALGETATTAFPGDRGKALEGRGYITISGGHIQAVIP